ncbi:hypothetical protein SALWKB2_1603 [Snodgrassella alvi wkB2]|nr:hypothetical protein SALWKB2_1603 [Snodgrassella alvi wkB2]
MLLSDSIYMAVLIHNQIITGKISVSGLKQTNCFIFYF